MKEKLLKIKAKTGKVIRNSYELSIWKWLLIILAVAIFEAALLEMLGRRSLLSPFVFIFHNPIVFLYNVLILFFTLSIGLLFKRRGFAMGLVFLLWFAVGFINFVLLGYRITPFSAIDFIMFSDVISMFNIYFNLWQRIARVLGVILFIVIIVLAFLKIPKLKGKVNYVQGSIVVLVSFVVVYIMTFLALETKIISDQFTNLGTAYKSYGFVYCFSNSVIDQGITKPDDYNQANVDALAKDIEDVVTPHRTYKYKNNKARGTASANIVLKANKGADKNLKNMVRFSNAVSKANPIAFEIIPRTLTADKVAGTAVYNAKKGKWKMKLTVDVGGKKPLKLKLNKKADKTDFGVDTAFAPQTDGSYPATVNITGVNNFNGTVPVSVTVK